MAETQGGSYVIQKNGKLKLSEKTNENNLAPNLSPDYTQENPDTKQEVKENA